MSEVFKWLSAHWIELFGVLTGLASVFFLARNKGLLGWAFGTVNALFFVVLMFQYKLYADLTLNVYYVITCILGLYWWKRGGRNKTEKPITHLNVRGWVMSVIAVLLITGALGYFLDNYTDSDIAYIDSLTTAMSLVGQYLLARKVFENWYIWITADVIDIGLYYYKELYMVSAMTVIFLVLCVMGLMKWRRVEELQVTNSAGDQLLFTLESPAYAESDEDYERFSHLNSESIAWENMHPVNVRDDK